MKVKIFFFLGIIGIPALCSGAAPTEPLKKVSGPDLKVRIKNPEFLQAIGWHHKEKVSPQKEVTLKRAGWNQIPTKILLIPANKKKRPLVLDVKGKKKLTISKGELNFKTIPKETLLVWGQTPKTLCDLHTPIKNAPSRLTIIRFPESQVKTLRGFDYFEFQGKKETQWLHFFNDHGLIKNLSSDIFQGATRTQKMRCLGYHGGDCDQVFQVKPSAFGTQVKLSEYKLEKQDAPCPQ